MFGIFRTFLALIVVAEHLGPIKHLGPYAVFSFYILSGYLMTLIMHESYGYSLHGFIQYSVNRLLRIFPLYGLAALLSLLLIIVLGESVTRDFHDRIGFPATLSDALRNVFLVLTINTDTRLVPPAWALSIELCFYLAIGLGLSRRPAFSALWLAASLAYTTYIFLGGAGFSYRYYTAPAASLPFAVGACIYHLRSRQFWVAKALGGNWALIVLLTSMLLNYWLGETRGREAAGGLHFYGNLLIASFLVTHLAVRPSAPGRIKRLDSTIGDLSYPIYLLHYQGGMAILLFDPAAQRGNMGFLLLGATITLSLALAANRLIEPGIQKMRDRIRGAAPSFRGGSI